MVQAPLGTARGSLNMGASIPISMAAPMQPGDTSIQASPAQSTFPGSLPDDRALSDAYMAQVGYADPHFHAPPVQQGGAFFQIGRLRAAIARY